MFTHSLNVKTVLFQAIHFSISTQFSSIWPIDRTLSMKGYLAFPKALALQKPHQQIVLYQIKDTFPEGIRAMWNASLRIWTQIALCTSIIITPQGPHYLDMAKTILDLYILVGFCALKADHKYLSIFFFH